MESKSLIDRLLKKNLEALRSTAAACIANKNTSELVLGQKTYKTSIKREISSYMIFEAVDKSFLPNKLTTPYKGPYVVISQYKNDITCKHTNSGQVQVFHVAFLSYKQHHIHHISAPRWSSSSPTTMTQPAGNLGSGSFQGPALRRILPVYTAAISTHLWCPNRNQSNIRNQQDRYRDSSSRPHWLHGSSMVFFHWYASVDLPNEDTVACLRSSC